MAVLANIFLNIIFARKQPVVFIASCTLATNMHVCKTFMK